MSESGNQFRTAAFGGFHKQDVLGYITRTAKEHQEQLSALKKEAEQAVAAREELLGKYECAEEGRKKAAGECERLSELLTQRTTALERAERELAALRETHAAAAAQLEQLKEKVPQLEEDAAAYGALKDRLATIELEAHRSAQETVEKAQAESARIQDELDTWVRQVQSSYQRLRGGVSGVMEHLSGELEHSRAALAETGTLLQGCDEQLKALLGVHTDGGAKPPLPLPFEEESGEEERHG